MHKKIIFLLLLALSSPFSLHAGDSITCASATSAINSGLLDYLLPIFRQDTDIDVKVLSVGTGEALELGKQGKVDVVLVHDRDLEIQLVDEGYFIDREDIMYNDFVILAPPNDPAGLKRISFPLEAFEKIRSSQARFISRGDNSRTNMRENRIWASTGRMPGRTDSWYRSANLDMAQTIALAATQRAYTLADRATWLAVRDKTFPPLEIVLENDPGLHNQYGAMVVNPANYKQVNYQSAMNFVIWLSSPAGQQAIGDFRDPMGNALFTPNAGTF